LDKSKAEDKYCFFLEELSEASNQLNVKFHIFGAECSSLFSHNFDSYLHYCMGGDRKTVDAICKTVKGELELMDVLLASRPLNGFADWFYLQKS
jgi:hypothetical protein